MAARGIGREQFWQNFGVLRAYIGFDVVAAGRSGAVGGEERGMMRVMQAEGHVIG